MPFEKERFCLLPYRHGDTAKATSSSALGTASVAKRSGKTDFSERRSQT